MKLLRVTWDDSSRPDGDGWHDRDVIDYWHGRTRVRSVGYLVKETKRHITIASSVTNDELAGVMCIPKSSIRKRKEL